MSDTLGKVLYALTFCVALPLLLISWASTDVVSLPVPLQGYGWFIAMAGLLLMVTGMSNLWTYGKGLPMNAYPPDRFVKEGSYRFLSHPIYVGFCVACAGVSMACESPTGLYLVTPVMILCCWALVEGYERQYLKMQFGEVHESASVTLFDNLREVFPVWFVWLVGYEFLIWKGYDAPFYDTVMSWETHLPVIEWMEIPYVLTYPFVVFPPLLITSRKDLNSYTQKAWFLILGTLFLEFTLPFYASPRPFVPEGWLGEVIMWERSIDGPSASFPSFHVVWVFLSARTLQQRYPSTAFAAWGLAVLIALSCVLTGAHSTADVVAAAAFYFMVENRGKIAQQLQRWSETLANSWKDWRFGPFRVINHAVYSGLAGFTAGFILSQFTHQYLQLDAIVFSALVGGAVWGQWVEGSPMMLRPFGYYGGILGGMAAMVIIWVTAGVPMIYWLAVFAMATPMAQAVGRLRCLVQGCCHGSMTHESGIHYFNVHTRVGQIPLLKGQCIHNTQGYSILSNLFTTAILFRLQWGGASAGILAGCYFILSGAFRFVEEAYRGEPQTRIIGGLRLYQWMALGSVVFGAVLTTIPSDLRITFQFNTSWSMWAASLAAGLAWAFGMSMDFPESSRRYSRLTG